MRPGSSQGRSNPGFNTDDSGSGTCENDLKDNELIERPAVLEGLAEESTPMFPVSCSTPDRNRHHRINNTSSSTPSAALLCPDLESFECTSEAVVIDETQGNSLLMKKAYSDIKNPAKQKTDISANLSVAAELSTIVIEDDAQKRNASRFSNVLFQNRSLRLLSSAQRLHQQSMNRTRLLSGSSDGGVFCRICHVGEGEESFIYPCRCSGTMGAMHQSCVEKWLGMAGSDQCEICGVAFMTERKQKPFSEWVFNPTSQRERKNLLTDGLCFLVLTPLATVSTWLCVVGARHYYQRGGTEGENVANGYSWETVGLSMLTIFLILIYVVWCAVALRFHRRTFLNWQKKNQAVRVLNTKKWKKPRPGHGRNANKTSPALPDLNNNNPNTSSHIHSSRLSSVEVEIPPSKSVTMTISCSHHGNKKPTYDCKVCSMRRSQQQNEESIPMCSMESLDGESDSSPQSVCDDSVCTHRHFKVMLEIGSSFQIEDITL